MKFFYNILALLFCIVTFGIFDLNIKYTDGSSFRYKSWLHLFRKGSAKMRKSKRKLIMENLVLKIRVQSLENKLCPANQHDWVKIDFGLEGGTGHGDETLIYHYQCRRCDKLLDTSKIL